MKITASVAISGQAIIAIANGTATAATITSIMFWLAMARIATRVQATIAATVPSANNRGDKAIPRCAGAAEIIAVRLSE
jgi:hypothetical protein